LGHLAQLPKREWGSKGKKEFKEFKEFKGRRGGLNWFFKNNPANAASERKYQHRCRLAIPP
jgi:hypothetical protein